MNEINKIIADILLQKHDYDISKYEPSFLAKSVEKRIAETNSHSIHDYVSFLLSNEDETTCIIESLQISYSEFFRNSLTFSILERIVLPALFLSRKNKTEKEMRIWSAACASGQEPYSLSMLFHEHFNHEMHYRIFATDQRSVQIEDAQLGYFSDIQIKNLTVKRLELWFTKMGTEMYKIKPEIKTCIEFSVFDLFDERYSCPPSSIFGEFDVIFCANLLFYYKPKYQKQILEKITKSLVNGGYVVVGEAERNILLEHHFKELYPQSAIFQKQNKIG
jgi:chemotaxis protein methyltransferase CheR